MDPGPFIMVLLGCSQAADSCQSVAVMPVAYASQASCLGARQEMVALSADLGFERVVAECRPRGSTPAHRARLDTPSRS